MYTSTFHPLSASKNKSNTHAPIKVGSRNYTKKIPHRRATHDMITQNNEAQEQVQPATAELEKVLGRGNIKSKQPSWMKDYAS